MSTRTSSSTGLETSEASPQGTIPSASTTNGHPPPSTGGIEKALTLEEAGDEILSNKPYTICAYCGGVGGVKVQEDVTICDKCGGYGYAHTHRHLLACVALAIDPAPLPVSEVLQIIRNRGNYSSFIPNWKHNKKTRTQWGKPPPNIALGALLPPKDK